MHLRQMIEVRKMALLTNNCGIKKLNDLMKSELKNNVWK
jgi:hypothetical protein